MCQSIAVLVHYTYVEFKKSNNVKFLFNFQYALLEPNYSAENDHVRVKRGFFGKKGFLRTLFSTAYEVHLIFALRCDLLNIFILLTAMDRHKEYNKQHTKTS